MKNLKSAILALLLALLLAGCGGGGGEQTYAESDEPAESHEDALCVAAETGGPYPPSLVGDTNGQYITGHSVRPGPRGLSVITFFPFQPVPGDAWAVVSNGLLRRLESRRAKVIDAFWHGDDPDQTFVGAPTRLWKNARRISALNNDLLVAFYRPHSTSKYSWRQWEEIYYHKAVLAYFLDQFGVRWANASGQSGGGLVAVALLQETEMASAAMLASPILAVGIHYDLYEGGRPERYQTQYDPILHIGNVLPWQTVFATHDNRDKVLRSGGIDPYFEEAEKLGLTAKLVPVTARPPNYHNTLDQLGQALQSSEGRGFRPLRCS